MLAEALRRLGGAWKIAEVFEHQGDDFDPPAAIFPIQGLEERRLVRRSPHPEDRRALYVTLTRSGQSLVDKAIDAYSAGHKRMLTSLSSSERQALDALLRKLLVSLEASNGSKAGKP